MRSLIENPQPVFAALNRYPCTLLHGDFRAENLAYSSQPVALDWQEATRSLMTIDLAWFVRGTFVHNTMGEAGAIRYYRKQLEDCLGRPFPDTEWQEMVDLGRLVDALRITCVDAYWYRQNADNPEGRSLQALRVKTRNQQVRDAMHWLEE
jgi:aminoglycoside/choline kinase family phosphotransferase